MQTIGANAIACAYAHAAANANADASDDWNCYICGLITKHILAAKRGRDDETPDEEPKTKDKSKSIFIKLFLYIAYSVFLKKLLSTNEDGFS